MAMDKNQTITLVLAGLIIVAALLVVFLLFFSNPNINPNPNPNPNPEEKTTLYAIVSSGCTECVDLNILATQIRNLGVDFEETQLVYETDAKAEELVAQYSITKLPGLVLVPNSSDFNILSEQWTSIGTIESQNVLVLRSVPLPYLDLASNSMKGLVEMWSIAKSDCTDCTPAPAKEQISSLGIFIASEHLLSDSDAEAQQLIADYNISKLPAVVLSAEINDYEQLVQALEGGGTFESDGSWVLRTPAPYYWDLSVNKKVGAVSLYRLTKSDCNECFNLGELESFFIQNFGLKIASDQNMDYASPEGKQFVLDYNISKLPTLVLSGELFAYSGLAENWSTFGFETADKKLVFSQHGQLGPGYSYFDLDQNAVVTPETPNQ